MNNAQSFEIKGRVIDSKNSQPISFCNIIVKGQPTKGVVSDYEGNFSINVIVNEILLISYVGYENYEYAIIDNKNALIKLARKTISLPEFVISTNTKKLNPKEIVKKVGENWQHNHYKYNNSTTTKIEIEPHLYAYKNDELIYKYVAESVSLKGIEKSLFLDIKDTIYRTQKENIPVNALNLPGGTPYFIVSLIFFKPPINNKYSFEFGAIEYYNNQSVYHIKFHRKKGGGICEGGGYYLISKSDFSLLYYEWTTKNCVGIEKEDEKLTWQFHKSQVFYNKNDNNKYSVSKVKSNTKFLYNNKYFYYDNNVIVKNIKEGLAFDKINLMTAKDVFYKNSIVQQK